MTLAEHEAIRLAARAHTAAQQATTPAQRPVPQPAGYYSEQRITQRNGGVRHQFASDIGGCSENYR